MATGAFRLRWAVAALCLSGCGSRETRRVELDGYGFDHGFLVTVDAARRPLRVTAIVAVDSSGRALGALPAIELAAEETNALFVGITEAGLRTAVATFDPSRSDAISVAVTESVVSPSPRVHAGGRFADLRVPDDAILVAVDAAGQPSPAEDRGVLAYLVLTIPVDPQPCAAQAPVSLRNFASGDEPRVLPRDWLVPGFDIEHDPAFRRIIRMDDDRVLAMSRRFVFVVTPGQTFDASSYVPGRPGSVIPVQLMAGSTTAVARAEGLAVGAPADPRTVVVVGSVDGVGRVWELTLSADGLEFVGTATVVGGPSPMPFLTDVTIDPEGNAVAVGDLGALLFRRPGEAAFTGSAQLPSSKTARRVIATGDAQRPHLTSTDDGQVHHGNLLTGAITRRDISDGLNSVHAYGMAAADAGHELWLSAWKGMVFRRGHHGDWQRFALHAPPELAACSTSERLRSGYLVDDHIMDVALDGVYAYLILEQCNAVVRVRRSDLCVSFIPRGDERVSALLDDMPKNESLSYDGARLTVGAEDGRLYELEVTPP